MHTENIVSNMQHSREACGEKVLGDMCLNVGVNSNVLCYLHPRARKIVTANLASKMEKKLSIEAERTPPQEAEEAEHLPCVVLSQPGP